MYKIYINSVFSRNLLEKQNKTKISKVFSWKEFLSSSFESSAKKIFDAIFKYFFLNSSFDEAY